MANKLETLKSFLSERLSAVTEEIFDVLKKTLTEYEGEITRVKEENARLRSFALEVAVNPASTLSDPRMLALSVAIEENATEPQDWSPASTHEDQVVNTKPKEEQSLHDADSPQPSQVYETLDSTALTNTQTAGMSHSEPQPTHESEVTSDSSSAQSECDSESEDTEEYCSVPKKICKSGNRKGKRGRDQKLRGGRGGERSSNESPPLSIQIQTPSFLCKICGKSFRHMGNLNVHVRVHVQEKPHRCGVCGKTCRSPEELVGHQETHIGDKPWQCHACGKSFKQAGDLTVHMRFHTGEKPFKCSECQKSFISASTLRVHQRIHSGEKPHCCELCGKCFTQKVHLNVHMKVHMKKKQ